MIRPKHSTYVTALLIELLLLIVRGIDLPASKRDRRRLTALKVHLANAAIDTLERDDLEVAYRRTRTGSTLVLLKLKRRRANAIVTISIERLGPRARAKVFQRLGFPRWRDRSLPAYHRRPCSFERSIQRNGLQEDRAQISSPGPSPGPREG